MNSLLTATTVFIVTVIQVNCAPQDDPVYKLFAQEIQTEQQKLETRLNSSVQIISNITKTFNIPEFSLINSTLYACFESVKAKYPDADETCTQYVEQDLQQIISDSESAVEACNTLTYGWGLIDQLLVEAEDALISLNFAVGNILNLALECVKFSDKIIYKIKCLNSVKLGNEPELKNATKLTEGAYKKLSGGILLLGSEVKRCQEQENMSFENKCNTIISSYEINCVK